MSKRPSLAESMRSAVQLDEPAATSPVRDEGSMVPAKAAVTSRAGKKKVTLPLPPEDHKRLRRLALDRDATTEALLVEAVNDLFAKYGLTGAGQGSAIR